MVQKKDFDNENLKTMDSNRNEEQLAEILWFVRVATSHGKNIIANLQLWWSAINI